VVEEHQTAGMPVTTPELLRTFASWGDRIFVATSDEELTYVEAEARSAELARRMLALGVGKNTRVAMVLANGADWVITYLALARIGAHAILLNPFSRAPEVGYALQHSDAAIVVTGAETGGADAAALLAAAMPGIDARTADAPVLLPSHPFVRAVWWMGDGRPAWAADPWAVEPVTPELLEAVEVAVHPSDPVVTSYTSGTTAAPKAVVHSQGAILRQAEKLSVRRHFTPEDSIYTPMPFFWMGGLCFVLLQAARRGMIVATDARFDPGRALDLIERYRITAANCWPLAAEAMATHPSFPDRDLSSLRAAPTQLRGAEWDDIAPDQREQSLGMTETCGPHTYPFDSDAILPDDKRGSFGPTMERMEHKIVDRETREQLPDGEIGELLVRGECLMLGFHKRERQDTFDADGWYATGDLCSWRDGLLYFHGRGGDMIKTAGFNVAPAEVERAIDALEEVMYVGVVGVPDPVREQVVGAMVALKPGSDATVDTVRAAVAEQISSYKVPTRWLLVDEAEFPMSVTGKVDRTRVRELLADLEA
jgi:acyl-CoA synthetase (AMP-forming)/AMP-acid ligase II